MVKTPVLFETFIRDDTARKVFDVIKEAKPQKLYFYSNKGRDKNNEIERNDRIRSWVNEIDWDCELHTFFRDECVDVYTSLRGAIDWVFENEDNAIILEDDIVPTLAFFDFCDQMIEKFKNDCRIWYISGDNFWNINPSGFDYIFSRYHWLYGWATWKDRWLKVPWNNPRIKEFVDFGCYNQFYKTKKQIVYQKKAILELYDFLNKTKCWDSLFGLTANQNNACGVFPTRHLITNIGLVGAHHSKPTKSFVNNAATCYDDHYIIKKDPPFIFADQEYDYQCFMLRFPLKVRLKNFVGKKILKIFGREKLNKVINFFFH